MSGGSLSDWSSVETALNSCLSIAPGDGGPSQYESTFFYYGTSPDPAPLVYRSDSAEMPFEIPTGMEAYPVEKELHGVFNHPVVDLWNNKGLANKVRDLITSGHPNVHWTSIDGVRFGTRQPDGTLKMTGPVIWIAVKPGSTTFQAAKLMGDTVVAMLHSNEDLADVKVEVRESFTQNAAALFVPNNDGAAASIRGPLSTGLGVSIATLEGNNQQQGTGTIFGVMKGKAVMLTCHHVACHMDQNAATDTVDYTFCGAGMPPQAVYCQGQQAFEEYLKATQARIGEQVIMQEFYEGKIHRLQEKTPDVADVADDLQQANRDLDTTKDRIAVMERAFHEIKKDFIMPSQRKIGHLIRSPPLQLGVGPYHITEDWALIELKKEMVQNFSGNFIDLGPDIAPYNLTKMMYPIPGGQTSFKFPNTCLLRVFSEVPMEELNHPELKDQDGNPARMVLKQGKTTRLTVGCQTAMMSVVRAGAASTQSTMEVAILSHNRDAGLFAAKGDSGSLVVDGKGRKVGMLIGGTGSGPYFDITYVSPWDALKALIEEKCPGINWNPTTTDFQIN